MGRHDYGPPGEACVLDQGAMAGGLSASHHAASQAGGGRLTTIKAEGGTRASIGTGALFGLGNGCAPAWGEDHEERRKDGGKLGSGARQQPCRIAAARWLLFAVLLL